MLFDIFNWNSRFSEDKSIILLRKADVVCWGPAAVDQKSSIVGDWSESAVAECTPPSTRKRPSAGPVSVPSTCTYLNTHSGSVSYPPYSYPFLTQPSSPPTLLPSPFHPSLLFFCFTSPPPPFPSVPPPPVPLHTASVENAGTACVSPVWGIHAPRAGSTSLSGLQAHRVVDRFLYLRYLYRQAQVWAQCHLRQHSPVSRYRQVVVCRRGS